MEQPQEASHISRGDIKREQGKLLKAALDYGGFCIRARGWGMRQPLKHKKVMLTGRKYRSAALRWYRAWNGRRLQEERPIRSLGESFQRSENPIGAVIQAAKALGHAVESGDKELEKRMIQDLMNCGERYARRRAEARKGGPKPGRDPQ